MFIMEQFIMEQFIENYGIDELIMMLKIKPKEQEENWFLQLIYFGFFCGEVVNKLVLLKELSKGLR